MSFDADVTRFFTLVKARQVRMFREVASELEQSVVEGSTITGAPGQPVKSSNLKTSWVPEFVELFLWRLTTNVVYAPGIEEGIGPHGKITLRSEVGGFHSVKLTVAGFPKVVDHVARGIQKW